ncbi:uroporphyrinogen decarboxylase [Legionella jordanis]|uniref:Uroporphyrinogen decarboxylase n=1 Tax=Legionella jordanis TaxID=456 RepID=A0A0W0VA61_9GAMM|nr:uroporphyrinogen decarboxylase [Legionella jordanis]KTD16765.1 uroporphyrinogen decarboxylase [Legionella jordanis]RMX03707.1 uroporphyrinogen decarboxylase [Legionella jordanis]RMX22231.1 uroporphyrinogen decarboxylase [Legionella jordanis]VEH11767.1 uroporphyrinogen decarboxylase [Legionella jordanis]
MQTEIVESLLVRALKRKPVPRTPVWIMRQAGRYLPEYRLTREKAGDFLSLCKNPDLACEVTLQPLKRFKLDAAILFSDILTIPDAMGLELYFTEGEGPAFRKPVRDFDGINQLQIPKAQDLDYVMKAVTLIRREMPKDLPLIGFSGSPWTLSCYMVEGGGSRDFRQTLKLLYTEPQSMHLLLAKLTQSVTAYLEQQIQAGVNVVMLFDTWGGILTTNNYQEFSLNYMAEIVKFLKTKYPHIPIILFTKGGGQWLKSMAQTGCDALGLDWTCDLGLARAAVGDKVALQGNLDPSVLLSNPESIRHHVQLLLESFGHGEGHVFNLGHGITPDVPPEHVSAMIEAVHELSPKYHGG